jgi:lysozyme
MRPVPQRALDLIKHFEGCHLAPYHDVVGFPTQGYGRLLSRRKGDDLSLWPAIDRDTAERWLEEDAKQAARSVVRLIDVPLSDGQFAALVDFVFNLGGGNLELSTLRKVINRGDLGDAPEQFRRWVHAGKTLLRGLVRRRDAEIDAWIG